MKRLIVALLLSSLCAPALAQVGGRASQGIHRTGGGIADGAGDGIAPTVSISAPANNASVAGTVSVTATAADNIDVIGVRFKLDGANLASEDLATPFSISWDTTAASEGLHSLTAVARDAAGNSTISSSISVTVSNSGGGDTPETAHLPAEYLTANDTLDTTGFTVMSGGSTMANVQTAVNQAIPNTVITLTAGARYAGQLTLPKKTRTSSQWVVFRTTGIASIPAGTTVTSDANMAILSQNQEATPVVITAVGSNPKCAGYRFEGIAFEQEPSIRLAYNHITLGSEGSDQDTLEEQPEDIVFDRCYFAPNGLSETSRGIQANIARFSIIYSKMELYGHDQQDTQCIACWNGSGPARLYNNSFEGAGENTIWGGSDPTNALFMPHDLDFRHNRYSKRLAWFEGILSTPPQPTATLQGGGSLAPSTTYLYKIVQWGKFGYNASDPAGRDIFSKASATRSIATDATSLTVRLTWNRAAHVTIFNPSKFTIYRSSDGGASWSKRDYTPADPTAASYQFDDTGGTGAAVSGSFPREFLKGTLHSIKNLFEIKFCDRALIADNLFEHHWGNISQQGPAILFTPRNQNNGAPFVHIWDVTFEYNILRYSPDGFSILGVDNDQPSGSGPTKRITIRQNVLENINRAYAFEDAGNNPQTYGNLADDKTDGILLTATHGKTGNVDYPSDVILDHNTWVGPDVGRTFFLASPWNNDTVFPSFKRWKVTNNIFMHGYWGLWGVLRDPGNATLATYLGDITPANQRFHKNVFIGPFTDYGASYYSSYTGGPSVNYFESSPTNPSLGFTTWGGGNGGNYVLVNSSSYKTAATDGTAIGADVATVYARVGVPLP